MWFFHCIPHTIGTTMCKSFIVFSTVSLTCTVSTRLFMRTRAALAPKPGMLSWTPSSSLPLSWHWLLCWWCSTSTDATRYNNTDMDTMDNKAITTSKQSCSKDLFVQKWENLTSRVFQRRQGCREQSTFGESFLSLCLDLPTTGFGNPKKYFGQDADPSTANLPIFSKNKKNCFSGV